MSRVKMRTLRAVVFLCTACLPPPASATPITLQPTDILRLEFSTLSSPDCTGPCDTLIFVPAFTYPTSARITTARLFDSSTLLGTYETDAVCLTLGACSALVPAFVTSESIYGLNAAVIDFTSILNGTIQGVLDIRFDMPIVFDPDSSSNWFLLTHATDRGVGVGGYFRDYDRVSVYSVPEPTSITLLGVGLASIVARRKRQKFCRR